MALGHVVILDHVHQDDRITGKNSIRMKEQKG